MSPKSYLRNFVHSYIYSLDIYKILTPFHVFSFFLGYHIKNIFFVVVLYQIYMFCSLKRFIYTFLQSLNRTLHTHSWRAVTDMSLFNPCSPRKITETPIKIPILYFLTFGLFKHCVLQMCSLFSIFSVRFFFCFTRPFFPGLPKRRRNFSVVTFTSFRQLFCSGLFGCVVVVYKEIHILHMNFVVHVSKRYVSMWLEPFS